VWGIVWVAVHVCNKPPHQLDQQTIYKLIQKYKNKTATEAEIQQLLNWYRDTANQDAEFPEDEESVGNFMFNRLVQQTKPRNKKGIYAKWAVAASILLLAGAGMLFLIQKNRSTSSIDAVAAKQIVPGGNKAVLTLADGTKISLTDAGNGEIAKQSGIQVTKAANGQLVYHIQSTGTAGTADAAIAYNTIETPKGGQYQLVLQDGTKVWVNAASTVKFPVNFNAGTERRVELSGEAYFEVAHNKKLPFRVVTNNQMVEVLGTHFNVNAYTDEPDTKTTLLQGSVKVTANNNTAMLKPGQQADLDNSLHVSYVNTEEAVAWKNGYFQFDDEKLETIMRKIARWYDVQVVYEDESTKNELFAALTTRFANINTLLKIMEQTGDAHFNIKGSTITISKKSK
jgi:transmembrane sensor